MDGSEVTRPTRKHSVAQSEATIPEEDEDADETMKIDITGSEAMGSGATDFLMHRATGGATSKKTWVFDAGDPLTCIAVSNFFPLIAVAGRNLLQVLRVDGDRFVSVHRLTNLQRNITSTNTVNTSRTSSSSAVSTAASSGVGNSSSSSTHFQPPRSYVINDVAWSDSKSILATCSNAGDLIIWDLSRGISQNVCFVGHSRSVHRINFNPNAPNEIISASHDGTVKLFDIRDQSCRQTFNVRTTAPSPVRDVVYCPREGHTLAGAFENGLVCIWDTRNESRPARCFQAHNAVTASIDWHPMWNSTDRNWLATSGGRDNTIMVWDLNKVSPTTVYSLRCKNTGHVRWRFGETTQLVSSCSLSLDLSIHLWELNRPYIPYITFEGHSHPISGISWSNDPNAFFSVGRDGLVVRHYVGDGIQTVRTANPVALALNCRGLLAHAIGGEPGQRIIEGLKRASFPLAQRTISQPAAPAVVDGMVTPTASTTASTMAAAATRTPHQLLVARRYLLPSSDLLSEEDQEEFGLRPVNGTTPANIIPAEDFIAQSRCELFVSDYISEKDSEAESYISSLYLPDTFVYLAKNYRISGACVEEVCDYNAAVARSVNQDFLSQFWLTLKMLLGNDWQAVPPQSPPQSPPLSPTASSGTTKPIREVEKTDTKAIGGPMATQKALSTTEEQKSMHRATYAEVANRRSEGVCVLDFISEVNSVKDRLADTIVSESEAPKENPTSGTSIVGPPASSGSGGPAISTAGTTSQQQQTQTPPQASVISMPPRTGSLVRSVNFLFAHEKVNASSNVVGGSEGLRRPSEGTTPAILPVEGDAFFDETAPTTPQATIGTLTTVAVVQAEEEQHQAFPRKSSLPDADRKLEHKSSTEESVNIRRKPQEPRDALNTVSTKRRPSARLDLTSALDCVEAIDSNVVANLTRPLDFTHQVGAWFLEMIEAGHVQTVCTALLIFGTECTRINEWASEKQIETWFYAYIDTLVRFRLWSVSTRIIKHCGNVQGAVAITGINATGSTSVSPTANAATTANTAGDSMLQIKRSSSGKSPCLALPLARHIAILNQTDTSVAVRCGKCAKILHRSSPAYDATQTAPHASWACARHPSAETALSTCAVCHMTVRGIYLWCIGCNHGGHFDHIREWITRRSECPAGCGHYCEYGKLDGNLYLQISA